MPQTQSPVSAVSCSRISRHDCWDHQESQRPYYIGGAAAPGPGHTSRINPWYRRAWQRKPGGQHSASNADDDHADLAAFEAARAEAEGVEAMPW
jgi:hypothetical protein